MRKRLIPGLYVGDMRDCEAAPKNYTVVHACRHPCYVNRCGIPKPTDANYLVEQKDGHLWMNLIDAQEPMFERRSFELFLQFARSRWDEKTPMVIHSNRGGSRAPALAMLFLAKGLYRIRNSSFDDAWVDFEQLAEEEWQPSEGMEGWLRDNWRALDMEVQYQKKAKVVPITRPDGTTFEIPNDPKVAKAIFMSQPLLHFASLMEIESKENVWIVPNPNVLQRQIAEAYDYCQTRKIPCRLVILKPRQVGCSTFCVALCRHHVRHYRCDMMIIGDIATRTQKLWEMMQSFDTHDRFPWDSKVTKSDTEKIHITFPDGEKGTVEKDTAMSEKAGISSTRQVILWTEVGRWLKAGGRDKKVAMASMISLANVPNSVGIMESTAEGSAGIFFETFKGAVPLADRKAEKKNADGSLHVGNGFISIFAAWHEFPEYSLKRKPETQQYFDEELNDREKRGIAIHGWSMEQIAWRRSTIAKECGGDPRQFDQDFPEDAEVAFLASGRARFNQGTLALMEQAAMRNEHLGEVGFLNESEAGQFKFSSDGDSEDWLWCCEKPMLGRSYIAFIDPCTGAQAEGSPDPDAHGPGVWRAGFHERNVWHPPRLVAMLHDPLGCRWDDEIVAERLKRVADWYGGCMIVPEVNKSGVLNELQRLGATIYQRERLDAIHLGRRLQIAGWETTGKSRPLLVNAWANYIREYSDVAPSVEVFYMPLIQELRTMVVNGDRAEAKSGCHDDLVFGSALGLYNLELAQPYMPRSGGGEGFGANGFDSGPMLPGGLSASALS